ncbi:hypothetical protein B0H14DRAFT_2605680 [Mycena olivaceomarginata]|nr:hypothetical protein B0H14DRAFT_2605680 [Mycena olivaceomarginata]
MHRPKKKLRGVYIHDPAADNVSTASTATNTCVRVEVNRAPPPSPKKPPTRAYNHFDRAMGYEEDSMMVDAPSEPPEGPAGIKIKTKKKKALRNTESDRPLPTVQVVAL